MKSKRCKSKSPLNQLQTLLSSAHRLKYFEEIKAHVLHMQSELDINLTTREQRDVLLNFEEQLAEEYPNVFHGLGSGRRVNLAMKAIIRQHSQQRHKLGFARRKSQKENAKAVYHEILDLTLDDSDEDKPRSSPAVSRAAVLAPRIRSRWAYSTSTGQANDPSILSSVPEQNNSKTPSASTSHLPAPSSSQVDIGGFNHIHHFLKSCSPSMAHLLLPFVEAGVKSVDILKAITCWTQVERCELLKKLRVPHCGELSELELIVLERRFQKYYLETSNGM